MSERVKQETYNTLQAMGYNYILVDLAYKRAPIKTTEGVLNYMDSNPGLQTEVNSQLQAQEQQVMGDTVNSSLFEQLLMMGFEDYMITAALKATNNRSVDAAMTWIMDNPGKIAPPTKTKKSDGRRRKASPKAKKPRKKSAGRRKRVVEEKKPTKGSRRAGERKRTMGNAGRQIMGDGPTTGYKPSTRGTRKGPSGPKPAQKPPSKPGTGYSRRNNTKKVTKKEEYVPTTTKTTTPTTSTTIGGSLGAQAPEFGVYDPFSRPKFVEDEKPEEPVEEEGMEEKEEVMSERQVHERRVKMLKNIERREMENKKLMRKLAREGKLPKKEVPKSNRVKVKKIVKKEAEKSEKLSKHQMEKIEKEKAKKEIMRQLAIDKARRFGKEVEFDEEEDKEPTVAEIFEELYVKMEAIYPIRTKKAKTLKTCLMTIGIYLSKKTFFFQKF